MVDNTEVRYTLTLLKNSLISGVRESVAETQKLNAAVNKVQDSLSGFKTAAIAAAATLAIREVVNTTADYQSLTAAINAGSVSALEGETNIKFLNNTIDELGLDLRAAFVGYKSWQGAIKETNLDLQVGRDIYKDVSKAITAMGLSGDDATGVFLAMGQMVSKGSVQSEELKGQLGERLPGAFQKAAKSMGLTTAELGKLLQKGEITAEEMLPKLSKALGIEFNDAAAKAAIGLRANLNRMQNAFFRIKAEVGDVFMPVILMALHAIIDVLGVLRSAIAFMKENQGFFTALAIVLSGVAAAMLAIKIQTVIATIAQWAYNTALAVFDALSGNYVAIAAGVAVLAAATYTAYEAQKALNTEMDKAVAPVNNAIKPKGKTSTANNSTSSKSSTSGTSAVEARGHQNFNIDIHNLIEKFTINATTIREGAAQAANIVKQTLTGAVSDFQLVANK